jgi:hypothetical protein
MADRVARPIGRNPCGPRTDAGSRRLIRAGGYGLSTVGDSVAHGAIAALPLLPHSLQCRMSDIDNICDPDIRLCRVLPMKAACVLLKCAFPGDWHREYQRVERRVIKPLADQLPGRQCVFRMNVTGLFGIVTGDFGNVTGHFGNVTERTGRQDWRCA